MNEPHGVHKSGVWLRAASDSVSREVSRKDAADLLRSHASPRIRLPQGMKILVGCEAVVVAHKPIADGIVF
jgi:hypothetical protein